MGRSCYINPQNGVFFNSHLLTIQETRTKHIVMTYTKVVILVLAGTLFAAHLTESAGGFGGQGGSGSDGPPQPYSFQYAVQDAESGNDYGHRESSDGNTVQGEYRVLLPDGRRQIVTYTADDASGYNADVKYEGEASRGGGGSGGFRPGSGGAGGSSVYLPPGK